MSRRPSGHIPQTHKKAGNAARIEVVIRNESPIDLLDFTASLTGLAREYEAKLRRENPKVSVDETRLLVLDIRKGSVILELLPVLAPLVSTAEITNTAVQFVSYVRDAFATLAQPRGRLPDATTAQLKNLGDTVVAVANDTAGEMSIAARYQNGDILQEIVVRKGEAAKVIENTQSQRKELEAKGSAEYPRVLMRLHQTSAESLKIGSRTSEKGVVERIDQTPRPLIYASDEAGRRVKSEILQDEGNPFQKGFIVDLDVETVGGIPKVYRILHVHDVIDLDE